MHDATGLYHQGVAHLDRDKLDEAIAAFTEGHLTAIPYTTTKAGADARRIL